MKDAIRLTLAFVFCLAIIALGVFCGYVAYHHVSQGPTDSRAGLLGFACFILVGGGAGGAGSILGIKWG
jgi:hypothetical protein